MAHCSAMICQQVTLSGDAEWPKVADAVIEALCGLTAIRGYADLDLRASTPVYYMDAASGAGAAFAVLCALHYRQRLARASSSTLHRRKICCRTSVSFSWMRRCMAVM